MIINNELFQKNLIGLSAFNPSTAKKISSAEENSQIGFKKSRNGLLIPFFMENGKEQPLHSAFDPEKEGERLSDHFSKKGAKIVFGLGGGYHILPLLKRQEITAVIIIEKDPSLVKMLFHSFDFSRIFSNTRVHLLVDEDFNSFSLYLLRAYVPGIHGDLEVIPLHQQQKKYNEYYRSIYNAINYTIDRIKDDFTVQSHFGCRWFTNTLKNLVNASKNNNTLAPVKNCAVIAAGPSLEMQIDKLIEMRNSVFCISTDTALPYLISKNIKPDCIISIDCQHISYLHFINIHCRDIPLVVDIASPRLLQDFSDSVHFISTSHPFSSYINKYWRNFPAIDISGGNVTHAALSLCAKLGARQCHLFGADFSYPEGKIYARKTYIYEYYFMEQTRDKPLLGKCMNIIFRNTDIEKIMTGNKIRYKTRNMSNYKQRLENCFSEDRMEIIPVESNGERINIKRKNGKKNSGSPVFFGSGKEKTGLADFINEYLDIIESLKIGNINIADYYNTLPVRKQEVFKTVLPVLSFFIRKNPEEDTVILLNAALEWIKKSIIKIKNQI